MAKDIERDILKEEPLDWSKNKVHRGLYSKPFAWKKSSNCLSTYENLKVCQTFVTQNASNNYFRLHICLSFPGSVCTCVKLRFLIGLTIQLSYQP